MKMNFKISSAILLAAGSLYAAPYQAPHQAPGHHRQAPPPKSHHPAPPPKPHHPAPPPKPHHYSTRTVVIPSYKYNWYNGYWVPCYEGWYYYGNVWVWGGPGPRPPYPPAWIPDPKRPVPPVVTPTYGYGWYNGYWVPCYEGWYYHGNVWVWGGSGRRPAHAPHWRPDPKRPAPRPPKPAPHSRRPAPAKPHSQHRPHR